MSLRARLLLAVAAVAIVSLVIADVVTYQQIRSFLYGRIDQSLETSHMPVEAAISHEGQGGHGVTAGMGATDGQRGAPAEPPTASDAAAAAGAWTTASQQICEPQFASGLDPGTFVEVRSSAGAVVAHCSVSPPLGTKTTAAPKLPQRITGFRSNASDFGEPTVYFSAASTASGSFRVRASVLRGGPDAGGELVLAVPLASTDSTLHRLLGVELTVTFAAIAAALLLGFWLVRVGMRPLRAIERTAVSIAAGELDQRVPVQTAKTEVGSLAKALNVMLGRIQGAFAERDETESELRESESRMRQFVADASHELRTPLAAVSAYAELFERGASRRGEDLERVLEGIRSESSRMEHLVEDLLLLARLDEGRPLEHRRVELVALAAEAIDTARAVGPEWPVGLVATEPVEVVGDRVRLRQVLDNLLSNVRGHTPPGTSAVVNVGRSGDDAVVSVSDSGPGLSAEQSSHVFERFYRTDRSRARSLGGAGLGLSIVASIVEAHSGTTSATGTDDGSVFTIRLPVAGHLEDRESSPEPAGGSDRRATSFPRDQLVP